MTCINLLLAAVLLVPLIVLGTSPTTPEPATAPATAPATPPPKRPSVKYPDAAWKGDLEFKYAFGKDVDRKPAFAVLHVFLTCRTPYLEAKKVVNMIMREEYWPNVFWKQGQDATPTLYAFNAEKKVLNRTDVVNSTAEEITTLLNKHGFFRHPDPEPVETEEQASETAKAQKTEL